MKPHTAYSPEEALALILDSVPPRREEEVLLDRCLHRVLSRQLNATLEDPRFDKSAVDGIGIRGDDTDCRSFRITGEIAAGDPRDYTLKRGQAVRIMTGARVPATVGQVIKFENCRFTGDTATVREPEHGTNIALRGESIRAGEPLMTPRRLGPPDIGVLAAQGYHQVPVFERPRVAVIATGDEIYSPGEELPVSGIYDSNSYQLSAFAGDAGAEVTNLGIAGDDPELIRQRLLDAVAGNDVVILSGGVSMGDLDFVPAVLKEIGAETVFHGLSMKPGRPTLYAVRRDSGHTARIFGLPGNPVSTAVQFEFLVRPLLSALEGLQYEPREAWLPLKEPYSRRNSDRHEVLPGVLCDGKVAALRYTGSGHITVLSEATLFYRVDRGVTALSAGDPVLVRFLRHSGRNW